MLERLFKKRANMFVVDPRREFGFAVDFVKGAIEDEEKQENKLKILSFIEELIKEDLQSDMLTKIIYNPNQYLNRTSWFPLSHLPYNVSQVPIVKIDLSTTCVIAYPWNRERYKKMIKTLSKEDFKYHKANHIAEYYIPLDICFVTNGHHSIAAGCGYKKGWIEAKEIDITPLFEKIYTDGQNWYECTTGKLIFDVPDFRIALLFEIAKMKYELQRKY